jgi:hypothetical protein
VKKTKTALERKEVSVMKKWGKLWVIVLWCSTVALTQGCATLNSSVPFKYVPALTVAEPNQLIVGMEELVDTRPEKDLKATKSISDVADKATATLLQDFRTSRIFDELHYPPQPGKDTYIIKGEINRFYWKYSPSPIVFIPCVGCLVYAGVPAGSAKGICEISLQVTDARTGAVVAQYNATDTRKSDYTIYNMKTGEHGAELADTFREVSKQFKDAIVSDIRAGRFKK